MHGWTRTIVRPLACGSDWRRKARGHGRFHTRKRSTLLSATDGSKARKGPKANRVGSRDLSRDRARASGRRLTAKKLWRCLRSKKADTRARKIEQFIAMLERKRRFIPNPQIFGGERKSCHYMVYALSFCFSKISRTRSIVSASSADLSGRRRTIRGKRSA